MPNDIIEKVRSYSVTIDDKIIFSISNELIDEERNSAPDEFLLSELLSYDSCNFIELIYRSLLRRAPEATAWAYYSEALLTGKMSKLQVIKYIYESPERVSLGVKIRELELEMSKSSNSCFLYKLFEKLIGKKI